ncbi:MAG: hypothetical protein GY940_08400, partial [bacterium]|nr:hypothetical protein [bacterium]
EGAGYFLESYSDTLLFMKKVELSGRDGLDHGELSAMLGSALTNMEQANKTYGALKQRADGTPYNTAVTGSLQGFDYVGFGAANGLEKGVVDRVKNFLSKGDVRSVYREIVMDTGTIAGLLKELKEQVDGGAFPSIKDTWKLNRAFSQSLGFGQCVAEVFDRVLAEN